MATTTSELAEGLTSGDIKTKAVSLCDKLVDSTDARAVEHYSRVLSQLLHWLAQHGITSLHPASDTGEDDLFSQYCDVFDAVAGRLLKGCQDETDPRPEIRKMLSDMASWRKLSDEHTQACEKLASEQTSGKTG